MKQEVFTFTGLDIENIKTQIEHLIYNDYTINNVSLTLENDMYTALIIATKVIHIY